MIRTLLVLVLLASPALAQQGTFEPPRATTPTDVPYPANAPAHATPIVVTVKLLVGADGRVAKVDPVTPPQPIFDEAVIAATSAFVFAPGTFDGKPVEVEITFTHTFQPPPPPPPPPTTTGPARSSILRGKLVELGTRVPLAGATVTVEVDGRAYEADGDQRGHFEIAVPPGEAKVTVTATGHNVFVQRETLALKQELSVTYLVERDRYDPYEIVVMGEQRRQEVSRITLRGPELKQVPGTFGDPFRVVQALPGVASAISLLPFPIIRGSSPSSTGFLLDGTRVPLLYHLLSGPSVIHPEFIEQIDFYPGGAPVGYGGYTGGIIDGRTARAPSSRLVDVDANLLQVGGLLRQPLGPTTVSVAGRYGYPGLLLSLVNDDVSLSYWDYQLRVDGGTKKTGWTVFAFGANDILKTRAATSDPEAPEPELQTTLDLGFHRLDLRYHHSAGDVTIVPRLVLGYDRSITDGETTGTYLAEGSLRATYKAAKQLELGAGLEGAVRDIDQTQDEMAVDPGAMIVAGLDRFTSGAVFVEAFYRPTSRWLIRPGVRADAITDGETTKLSLDPRLTLRYALARRDLEDVAPDSDDSAVWLKASTGIYHQPPRFILPLPGFDLMPLRYGLLTSYQSSVGIEAPLASRIQLTAEAFYNHMDPTLFDLSFNEASVVTEGNTTLFPTSTDFESDGEEFIERLRKPRRGRSYGLEVMLRRQAKSGLFGWVSYTLSRSEREYDTGWAAFDFDRTHLFNLVAGIPLRRNWDVGARVQYQSGRPQTTTAGYNEARTAGYVRFDVRVDKRVAWNSWLLDFYVDLTNVALLPEEVTSGTVIRYVLPTLGVRGRI